MEAVIDIEKLKKVWIGQLKKVSYVILRADMQSRSSA
jgi:hypothetical protein